MRQPSIGRSLCIAAILAGIAANASAVPPPEPEADGGTEAAERGDSALLVEDPLFDEDDELVAEHGGRDPFEGVNRDVFAFNRRVDRWIFDPITRGYRFVLPESGRRAMYRVSLNLDTPVVLANHMLQFRVVEAAGTLTRFVINSSFGLAGLFDPSADFLRVPRVEADFGQTLARYGSPSGPFLMLPIFGPSTVRDVFGDVVDIVADPLSYLLGPFPWWTLALGGSEGLIVREASFDQLRALEAGSIDFYAALRSAYLQSRDAAVREARETDDVADSSRPRSVEAEGAEESPPACAQPSPPAASFAIFSSSATISASRSSRFTIDANSERRKASSLTVPSR